MSIIMNGPLFFLARKGPRVRCEYCNFEGKARPP
jgi:hypothetical protein